MVRPARPDEAAQLVDTYDWLFAPPGSKPPMWDPQKAEARIAAAIAEEGSDVLVSEAAGEIVGVCTVYLDFDSVRFGRRAWIEDLSVHPEHRSQGHGKALLDAAKDWARTRGASHLELDSADERVDAHRFYRREGAAWSSRSFGWLL